MYTWVRLRPHTHTKCGLRFPPQYHISYRWSYYLAPLCVDAFSRCYVQWADCFSIMRVQIGLVYLNHLKCLSAQEEFIRFCHCESFKTHMLTVICYAVLTTVNYNYRYLLIHSLLIFLWMSVSHIHLNYDVFRQQRSLLSINIQWNCVRSSWDVLLSGGFRLQRCAVSYSHLLKVKVKCTLVQALRLCTGCTAHRGSRGIALPFLDSGTRRGLRGQHHSPATLYPRERPGTHCTQGCVGPRAGLDRCRKSCLPTRIWSPDHPARSQSLYWLSYLAHSHLLDIL